MATKGGKKSTKKVKTLAVKNVSAEKAKRVKGGLNFAKVGGSPLANISSSKLRFK